MSASLLLWKSGEAFTAGCAKAAPFCEFDKRCFA
jgi:hypothetical protein